MGQGSSRWSSVPIIGQDEVIRNSGQKGFCWVQGGRAWQMQLEENISRLLGCMDDCREGEERRVGPYLKGMSNSQGWQAGGGERGRPLFNTNGEEGANWYCSFAGGVREVWGETHDGFMGTGEDRAARKTGHGFEDVICGIFPFPCLHGDALPLQLNYFSFPWFGGSFFLLGNRVHNPFFNYGKRAVILCRHRACTVSKHDGAPGSKLSMVLF